MRSYERRNEKKVSKGHIIYTSGGYWSEELQAFVRDRREATPMSFEEARKKGQEFGSFNIVELIVIE